LYPQIPDWHAETLIERVQSAVSFIRGAPARGILFQAEQNIMREAAKERMRLRRETDAQSSNQPSPATHPRVDVDPAAQSYRDLISEDEHLIDAETNHAAEAKREENDDFESMDHRVIVSKANRLKMRNITRWSSVHLMLDRFHLWAAAVNEVLSQCGRSAEVFTP
jgi:hypothetical protein